MSLSILTLYLKLLEKMQSLVVFEYTSVSSVRRTIVLFVQICRTESHLLCEYFLLLCVYTFQLPPLFQHFIFIWQFFFWSCSFKFLIILWCMMWWTHSSASPGYHEGTLLTPSWSCWSTLRLGCIPICLMISYHCLAPWQMDK